MGRWLRWTRVARGAGSIRRRLYTTPGLRLDRMKVSANGLSIEVEDHGSPNGEPLLLIMGLGMQLVAWHEDFVASLVERGFRVVRFDNRDIGLSQGYDQLGVPKLGLDVALRRSVCACAALCARRHGGRQCRRDGRAGHRLGACVRRFDGRHDRPADRVAAPGSPQEPDADDDQQRLAQTPATDAQGPRRAAVAARRSEAGRQHRRPLREALSADRQPGLSGHRRLPEPAPADVGAARVPAAGHSAPAGRDCGRRRSLTPADRIKAPTQIIHGRDDPLVPVAAGHDLAAKIRGARLDVVDGMGHDLPMPLWPRFVANIAEAAGRA